MAEYRDILKSDIDTSSFNILAVTATEVETNAIHSLMPDEILRVVEEDYTFYLGQVGEYNIIHVQCKQMGSLLPGSSPFTVGTGLKVWPQIKAVIMVGICYGFYNRKQHIGDVIVATEIKNVETRRMGEDKEIPRGDTSYPDKCLANAFKNVARTWNYTGIDEKQKRLSYGIYLSADKLVDNIKVRDKLLEENPEAKAGEMEGNGLTGACYQDSTPWILIKAVSDYGDGKKRKKKKWRQAIAVAASAHCFEEALKQPTVFESLGIYNVGKTGEPSHTLAPTKKEDHLDVLFEIYRDEYAPYFLRRGIDDVVESYIFSHNLWIYGVSGVGKTTSILHALLSKGLNPLLLNLSAIGQDSSLEEIIKWMYIDVADAVHETAAAPDSYQRCFKRIIEMLENHYAGQSVYVLVEELPFSGDRFRAFIEGFSSLVISERLSGKKADVHFVLSSIEDPQPYVPDYRQKFKNLMTFLKFDLWSEKECNALIDMIDRNLTVPKVTDKHAMIAKCGNLPRPIKTVFREAYHGRNVSELTPEVISSILIRFQWLFG